MSGVKAEDCTPEGQTIISCTSNSAAEACDEAKSNSVVDGMSPIKKVKLFQPVLYMSKDSESKNGVIISWKAPSALELNSTTGYVIWIYYISGSNKFREVCRYYRIKSSVTVIQSIKEEAVFKLDVKSLSRMNAQYQVEITTLPLTNLPQGGPAVRSFYTKIIPKPTTTTLMPYTSNDTYDTSQPFSLTAWFRRTSYYPHIHEQYKHLYYEVVLLDKNENYVKNLEGQVMTDRIINTSNTTEYAKVVYKNVRPGTYLFHVLGYKLNTRCSVDCRAIFDRDYSFFSNPLLINGTDYEPPNQPILKISSTNNITVKFYVAPANLLFKSYEIQISKSTPDSNVIKRQYDAPAKNKWQLVEVFINEDEVKKHFKYPDMVIAQVIPKANDSLCTEVGMCNIYGTCEPCSTSFSLSERINQPSVIAVPAWVTPVAVVLATVLFIAISVALIMKYVRQSKTCLPPSNPSSSVGGNYTKVTDEETPVTPKVCLAYISDNTYRDLNNILRSTLEQHFHCHVVIYTGIQDKSVFDDCDCVLVLYSWPLLETYAFYQQLMPPTQEMKERKKVLDLLLDPQPVESPPVLMAVYDHVPLANTNLILSRNSELILYKLPSEVKKLTTCLATAQYDRSHHAVKETTAMLRNWSIYENSDMEKALNKAIYDVAPYDSGFDTMSVLTLESHAFPLSEPANFASDETSKKESSSNIQQFVKGPEAMANQRLPPSDRTITINTTTPHADEKRFFNSRADSIEPFADPPHIYPPHLFPQTKSQDVELEVYPNPITDISNGNYSVINENIGNGQEKFFRQESVNTSGLSSYHSSLPTDSTSVVTVDSTLGNNNNLDSAMYSSEYGYSDSFKCSTMNPSAFSSNQDSTRITFDC